MIRNSAGYTLVEIIIVAGLASMLMMAIAAAVEFQLEATEKIQQRATRMSMMTVYREEMANLNLIRDSLHQPENTAFLGCVCGSATPCTSGQVQDFSLYEPGLVSPVNSVAYFDDKGTPCKGTEANCTLQAKFQFIAQCKPILPSATELPPPSCTTGAEFIGIIVTITANANISAGKVVFEPLQTAAYTQVADIAPPLSGVCP